MKAEAGTGKRILHRKKFPPFPRRKKREMPCPCRVKVVADCNALRRVQWGNTYSRRGDPTITACNGLGRRIRTRLVGFFSSFSCGAVKHRPALVPSGGSFFIPGQRSAVRRKSLLSIAKGVEIKQRGEISYLCARARKKQPNSPITLQRFGCLVEADRRIIFSSRKRERKKKQTSKPIHFFLKSAPTTRDPQRTNTDYISSSTSQ